MELFQGIDMEALRDSFVIMGEGMGGILFVLILIALIVLGLSKLTSRSPRNGDSDKK